MVYLDVDAVVDLGHALGRFAGERIDEGHLRRWVGAVVEAIDRDAAGPPPDTSQRGCKVTISTTCRAPSDEGPDGRIAALPGDADLVLLGRVPSSGGFPDWGVKCYDIGNCRMCITWTCSIFE